MATPDLGANLVAMFQRSVERRGDAPFLWVKKDRVYQPWRRRRSWHAAWCSRASRAATG